MLHRAFGSPSTAIRGLILVVGLVTAMAGADSPPPDLEGCTIGVASGRATADGRPLLWKVRDAPATPDNEVFFNDSFPYRFVAVVNADGTPESSAWMGVNEHGFAVLNSNVNDLAVLEPPGNGEIMRDALGTCRSAAEFVALLDSTNGERQTHANFAVIDSTGAALVIEASADTFWIYDTEDTPQGYLVRANFACTDSAGVYFWDLPGAHRFVRADLLVGQLVTDGELTVERLLATHMRDFSNAQCQPIPVPCPDCGAPDSLFGAIDTFWSICSKYTVSAGLIHGVDPLANPPEPAGLSPLWVQLGHPISTLASPYWPVGPVPAAANGDSTAPLCDLSKPIRASIFRYPLYWRWVDSYRLIDDEGGGFWATFLPREAEMIQTVAERRLVWNLTPPPWSVVQALEDSLAAVTLSILDHFTAVPPPGASPPTVPVRLTAPHPNPFNPTVTMDMVLARTGPVRLAVYDLRGRQIAVLAEGTRPAGRHPIVWRATGRPAGVYLLRLESAGAVAVRRCVLVK